MTARTLIVAAGAVVTRKTDTGPEVLLVHRPRYDDWSFPKGKLDPGEHAATTAVREVLEETGLGVRLGAPLSLQEYVVTQGEHRLPGEEQPEKLKLVHYWVGHLLDVEDGDVSRYEPNAEIDQVLWVPVPRARTLLTYERDQETLEEALDLAAKTRPLVVLRHGKALARKKWSGEERERPLTDLGVTQSELLVPILAAFGVDHVVSSSSTRCWRTVAPFAESVDAELEVTDLLSEQDATATGVAAEVARRVAADEPVVVCTHRPVLPLVFAALGVEEVRLNPGELLVVHLSKGKVLAVQELSPADVMVVTATSFSTAI